MESTTRPPAEFLGDWSGQVIATAIHTGHDLRPELAEQMRMSDEDRLREEDPHTDVISGAVPARVVVHRSRFEVDLNRDRDGSVYRTPQECWGLDVWRTAPLAQDLAEASRRQWDAFYAELGARLDEVAARGPFVVYDVHSYNHRRDGADLDPAPAEENPEVNVGTGSLDHDHFGPVVTTFMQTLAGIETSTGPLDVRENVRFQGAHLAKWIHERYPRRGAVLALEFKKTFMDEWTGQPDQARLRELASALAATLDPVRDTLAGLA